MPVKKKIGPNVKCDWCESHPKGLTDKDKKTFVHTNIHNDPPKHFFCTKSCLDSWVFQDNHRIITNFSNMNKQLFIKHGFIYKNAR